MEAVLELLGTLLVILGVGARRCRERPRAGGPEPYDAPAATCSASLRESSPALTTRLGTSIST